MVFFTRELFNGLQHGSGWERRATREWDRRRDAYTRYQEVIAPLLPNSVRRLSTQGLHDGVIRSASHRAGELVLLLDTRGALGEFRGRRALRLTFRGVAGRVRTAHLPGQWWLYEEAHLRSNGRFSLHVLLGTDELEIEADELLIARERRSAPSE